MRARKKERGRRIKDKQKERGLRKNEARKRT